MLWSKINLSKKMYSKIRQHSFGQIISKWFQWPWMRAMVPDLHFTKSDQARITIRSLPNGYKIVGVNKIKKKRTLVNYGVKNKYRAVCLVATGQPGLGRPSEPWHSVNFLKKSILPNGYKNRKTLSPWLWKKQNIFPSGTGEDQPNCVIFCFHNKIRLAWF